MKPNEINSLGLQLSYIYNLLKEANFAMNFSLVSYD